MKLGSIQFIRAIAVILVTYANATIFTNRFGKSHQADFHYLPNVGFIGMDLFFIISGFVISYTASLYRGFPDGLRFLKERFLRINPVYYIASLLFWGSGLLLEWLTLHSVYFNPNELIQNAIDSLLIIPATDAQYLYNPFIPIAWALAFTWLSYFLFFIAIISRVKRKLWLMAALVVLLTVFRYVFLPTDLRLTFVLNPILLEFLLGMVIYQCYQRINKVPVIMTYALLLIGIVSVIVLVFYNKPTLGWSGNILSGLLSPERVLYWGIPSACIVASSIFLEKAGSLKALGQNKLCLLLGNASYSIFLVHLTAFNLLAILYQKTSLNPPTDLTIILGLSVALIIGILFYRWVEMPMWKWMRRAWKKPSTISTPVVKKDPQIT